MELINNFFDLVYDGVVLPCVHFISFILNVIFLPVSSLTPKYQVFIIALVGALVSRFLGKYFKIEREKRLEKEFKSKLEMLGHTRSLEDEKLEKVVRSGIHNAADEVYEKIITDKFFEMGVTYFFPLFFFLIWLQYDRFTPLKLMNETGQAYVWVTASGLNISAAYLYLFAFNIFLFLLWMIEIILRLSFGKRKNKSEK